MVRVALLGLALVLLAPAAIAQTPAGGGMAEIRVVLADTGDSATIAGNLAWSSSSGSAGSSTELAHIKLRGDSVSVESNRFNSSAARLIAKPVNGSIRFTGREYRGQFEFFAGKGGGLVVLNVLPVEDYLKGVVPGEMPAGWPEEALKAQAVAARTYALSRMMVNRDQTYDVYSTVADQVYGGIPGEDSRTTAAIQQTAGQIITFDSMPITAYYSADAGGYTRQGSLPYLQAVPSFDAESPHNDWQIELGNAELSRIAGGFWQGIGQLVRIEAANDAQTGHLTSLLLIGDQGRVKLNPASLRKALGYNVMKSTRARIFAAGDPAAAPPPAAVAYLDQPDGPAITIAPFPQTPQPGAPGQITVGTASIYDFQRPFITSAEDSRDLKLRRMYAFNGYDLKMCEKQFEAADIGQLTAPPPVQPPFGDHPATQPGTPAPPVPATFDTETVVDLSGGKGILICGSGYGHGMGMSQWGARQLASTGRSYLEILHYFYSGVDIVGWDGTVISIPPGESAAFYEPFTTSH